MKEINDARPTSLRHVVGQAAVVDQLLVGLDCCFNDNKRLDDCLLIGPPGLGKSQIAHILSLELAAEFHEVLGQSIKTPADLNALLLGAKDRDVVHIDEVHELKKEFQTGLYLALDKRTVFVNGGTSVQSIPIADFTLLLSTTDEYCLLQPLRDRMKLTLRFQFYTTDELTELLRRRVRALEWKVEEQVLPLIAERSRGTPRLALRLLQACRRVVRSEGEWNISLQHFERACHLEAVDSLGLGPTEQHYLRILLDGGATRLNVIASLLGLPARTVSQVTEPFLIRSNLITKTKAGLRELTSKGREHLSGCCEIRV